MNSKKCYQVPYDDWHGLRIYYVGDGFVLQREERSMMQSVYWVTREEVKLLGYISYTPSSENSTLYEALPLGDADESSKEERTFDVWEDGGKGLALFFAALGRGGQGSAVNRDRWNMPWEELDALRKEA